LRYSGFLRSAEYVTPEIQLEHYMALQKQAVSLNAP
jgi:hypothetical protein